MVKRIHLAGFALAATLIPFIADASAQQLDLGDDPFNDATELGSGQKPATMVPADGSKSQTFGSFDSFGGDSFGKSPFGGKLDLGGSAEPKVTVSASPEEAGLGEVVTLRIHLDIPPGGHTYAQARGGDSSAVTRIDLKVPPSLQPMDSGFTADREPEMKEATGLGIVAQFEDEVTWSRRFRVASTDGGTADLSGLLDYQICDTACIPYEEEFTVSVALSGDGVHRSMAYRYQPSRGEGDAAKADPVQFQAEIFPANPTPGTEAIVALTLELDTGWKTYGLKKTDTQTALPTRIETSQVDGLKPIDEAWQSIARPVEVRQEGGGSANEHIGRVTWQKRFLVTDEPVALAGTVSYQLCSDDGKCLPPNTATFALGDAYDDTLVADVPTDYFADPQVFAVGDEVAKAELNFAGGTYSFGTLLLWAFLGGLILNIMPCVLPVLAIKVMGFVQQAGESRGRILALNIAYSAGVLLVFLIFAGLAVATGAGLGAHFQSIEFKVGMAVIVFLSGLSLLGVFEIPIPGYLGNAGQDHKEGLSGAFMTGLLATVLATPCTGPFIGTALAGTATQQPSQTFLLWATAGIGMAFPYLLAGVFPRVIAYLPRPGMWMIWFKQASGFILMATVVWLVAFTGIPERLIGPLLAFLVGLGFAAWVWGTFKTHSSTTQRMPVYVGSAVAVGLSAWLAVWLGTEPTAEEVLPWQPFSDNVLADMLEEGETVLVDFTADWCAICKQNEAIALNTDKTIEFVKEHGVKTLVADFTDKDESIKAWLTKFRQAGVPLTVIFPEGDASNPIVLPGPYTQGTLLESLRTAVAPKVASLP